MSVGVLLVSRAIVLAFAAGAFLLLGPVGIERPPLDGGAAPFGGAGEALLDVWSRWDSSWYLGIAGEGYGFDPNSAAFAPLYPLLAGLLAAPFGGSAEATFIAALAISLCSYGAALLIAHRLFALETDEATATLGVALIALFPMAIFSGAVYGEGPFLLASVGAFWLARTGRWPWACAAAGAAAATRPTGVLLLVPLALLFMRRPRRPRAELLWLALVPAGLLAYWAAAWVATGNPAAAIEAQALWGRELGRIGEVPAGPLGGLVSGAGAAWSGLGELLADPSSRLDPTGFPRALIDLEAFAFLLAAIAATAGALRRLPLAYGAYAAAALVAALSFPRAADSSPLLSLPRFVAVLFPLFLWAAIEIRARGRERIAVAVSALLLALYSVKWGSWMWVA